MIDAALVKARIAERAEDFVRELFGEQARQAGADKWRIGSHGSLAVEVKDGALVFYSHEDGAGGDAIAIWQRERGGSMGEALKACAAWAGIGENLAPHPARPPRSSRPNAASCTELPYAMSGGEAGEAFAMAQRLFNDADLCARLAKGRAWKAETLRGLALEPSLGWHEDKLAFLYESGVKLRWRDERGERIIRWHFGKPWLWRGGFLWDPSRCRVIVSEGETDAIRLIDAGAEADETTLVIALPSASTFAPEWAWKFAGKDVLLALDNDEAGRRATERVGRILQSVARSVRALDWKEAARAA